MYGKMILLLVTSSAVAPVVEEASKETSTTSSSSSTSTWDFTDKLVFLHTPLSRHLKVMHYKDPNKLGKYLNWNRLAILFGNLPALLSRNLILRQVWNQDQDSGFRIRMYLGCK